MRYGIKYFKIKYNDEIDLLIPKKVVTGELDENNIFDTGKQKLPYITGDISNSKYVIGESKYLHELREELECQGDEYTEDEVVKLYSYDKLDKIIMVKDDKRISINLYELFEKGEKAKYTSEKEESCLYLNQDIIDLLENMEDIEEIKKLISFYGDKLYCFEDEQVPLGVKSILVEDGHVTKLDVESNKYKISNSENYKQYESTNDFSVSGLYNYLRERIIGHDEELKAISTILFMNYISTPEFGTESILIPGPTGTGKTATFECAAKYFNVLTKNINTCNLVPEGIVGTTLEDEFLDLIEECNGDLDLAQKSILIFDEFDKIGIEELDIKKTLRNVLLKVFEGSNFPIHKEYEPTRNFNTTMASKIALGTFENAYIRDKNAIGFENRSLINEIFDKNLLVKKGYFNSELLTRFQHFIPYENLSEEDKKRIILESKLSTYLLKKKRLESQFSITTTGDEDFACGLLESLNKDNKSVRDINNLIAQTFIDIEYNILSNNIKNKKLVLNRDTVSKGIYDIG